jgi:hypothetical protein
LNWNNPEIVSPTSWIVTKDGRRKSISIFGLHRHQDQIALRASDPGTLTSVKVVVVVGVLADSTMKASTDPRTGQIDVDLS